MHSPSATKKIVIATIGSLGDLHPCLAIGQELLRRGYKVTIATTSYYKQRVEAHGLIFRSLRPDWDQPSDANCKYCNVNYDVCSGTLIRTCQFHPLATIKVVHN